MNLVVMDKTSTENLDINIVMPMGIYAVSDRLHVEVYCDIIHFIYIQSHVDQYRTGLSKSTSHDLV